MALVIWPAGAEMTSLDLVLESPQIQLRSPYTGTAQTLIYAPARWRGSCQVRLRPADHDLAEAAGRWEAFCASLDGGRNEFDLEHKRPTAAAALTVSSIVAGDPPVYTVSGSPGDGFGPGSMLRWGTRTLQVVSWNSGTAALAFKPDLEVRVGDSLTASTALRVKSSRPGLSVPRRPGFYGPYSLEFEEAV